MDARAFAFPWLCSLSVLAQAAGGHHAVEDAVILEPGQCQVESWHEREYGGTRRLVHLGPACRVGAVQFGLNVDRTSLASEPSSIACSPQLKWAGRLSDDVSVGVLLSAAWQDGHPRYTGSTLGVPLTWQVGNGWLLHLNGGRDIRRAGDDTSRWGVALEWAPMRHWAFVAEHYRESGIRFLRVASRWSLGEAVSIDLSHAQVADGGVPGWWTLGVNWVFDR